MLQAHTNAQSAWLRTMLVHGVITPEELLDETDKGLLHVYQRTVTTKHVMMAIKAVELWFTDKPSGCHGLLSRMCNHAERHFEGLQQASRHLKLPSHFHRKLCNIEAAYNIARHITQYSVLQCEKDLDD